MQKFKHIAVNQEVYQRLKNLGKTVILLTTSCSSYCILKIKRRSKSNVAVRL